MIVDFEQNRAHIHEMLKEAEQERVNTLFQRLFRKEKSQVDAERADEESR